MKKCSQCGRLETDSTGFCPDCGSPNFEPLIKDDSTNSTPAQAPSVEPSAPESAFDSFKTPNTPFEAKTSPFEANSAPNPFATAQPVQPQETGESYSYNGQTPNGAYSVDTNQNVYTNPNGTYNATVTQTVTANPNANEDKANVGLVILSVFIPIVGIILWAVKKKETPHAAKSYGLAGLIMIILNIVLSIIITVVTFVGGFAILDKTMEYANDYDSSYSYDYEEDSNDMIIGEKETEKATESSSTSTAKFASDNWIDFDKMQFAYNDKVYTLGETTLQNLIDDGVVFESDSIAHFDDAVDKDYESSIFYVQLKNGADDYTELWVKTGNFTTSTKKARELPITTVCYDAGFEGHGNIAKELRFVVPYDVTFQQVKDKCGEPDYLYQGDSYSKLEYTEEAEQYYNDKRYTFEFTQNALTSIELEYLP
ncbi:MAG: hypothetical protein ACI37Z_03630 [Candidatus Gastranaerophilaceae bacterium]